MLQVIKKKVNNETEDVVFKMWVHHRLLSVLVVLLTHFEGCRRAAKKLKEVTGMIKGMEQLLYEEQNSTFHAFTDGQEYDRIKNDCNMAGA